MPENDKYYLRRKETSPIPAGQSLSGCAHIPSASNCPRKDYAGYHRRRILFRKVTWNGSVV